MGEFAAGLSANESARLGKLTESVTYENAKDFRGKVALLKESYFGKTSSKKRDDLKRLPEETLTEEKKTPVKAQTDDIGEQVAAAISRQAKSIW